MVSKLLITSDCILIIGIVTILGCQFINPISKNIQVLPKYL